MARKLKLGIIGMSEGNGHPYSWSAIFNGYDPAVMKECPFPVIPEYLSKQSFPEDGLGHLGKVTHIWTQDQSISNHVAEASRIDNVVDNILGMTSEVDAVLLARDDAENHYNIALPVLEAGLPIYIDKPLALTVKKAEQLFKSQHFESQIFSCSAFRFANEIRLTEGEKSQIGDLKLIETQIPKSWKKYSVHLIEGIVGNGLNNNEELKNVYVSRKGDVCKAEIDWETLKAFVTTYGKYQMPFSITYFGELNCLTKQTIDTYRCFKEALRNFVEGVNNHQIKIPRSETTDIVKIIEKGVNA